MTHSRELQEMTLAELLQLFPISLTPHRPQWKAPHHAAMPSRCFTLGS